MLGPNHKPPRIYAIGHSTHTIDHFTALLKPYGIKTVVDVRTVPRSRHVPQFNQDSLKIVLAAYGMRYHHLPELGGLRRPKKDSINLAWKNPGFRGFADHMQTDQFEAGINRLLERSEKEGPVVIMCAEALPWRCHRSLIADALVARGVEVIQLDSQGQAKPHTLNSLARVHQGQVTYPGILYQE